MADDRVVKVVLSAEVREYLRGMEEASEKTKQAAAEAKNLKDRADALQTIGKYAVAFGAAMSVAAGAVAKTGIEYNTLQQTSRAALSTLLDGAEAANEQMDKLDEFATTSPFSKAVFIEAQQQLLGFGTEAERVVPILDAIQNAVAATGGSNQDIAELVRIIAQLEGGVKLSAETFNQFGTRGIDAAQLIGDAMGKTGQQIREEVTAGTLDADQAIQALTDGMSARFSGAAEGVKDTFDGAMDRVKAAWRDVSAELMRPLVDPNGGGFLIDAANGVADLMRQFQALPEPVKLAVGAIGGLTGATALFGGATVLALPKVTEFWTALGNIGPVGVKAQGALSRLGKFVAGPWGLSIAAGTTAVMGLKRMIDDVGVSSSELQSSLKIAESASSAWATAAAPYDGNFFLTSMGDDIDRFGERLEQSADLWSNWRTRARLTLDPTASDVYAFNELVGQMGEEISSVASTDMPEAQRQFKLFADESDGSRKQLWALLSLMPEYKDQVLEAATEQGVLTEGMSESERQAALLEVAVGTLGSAQSDAADYAGELESGLGGVRLSAEDAQEAVDDLASAIRGFGSEELSVRDAHRQFEKAVDDLTDSIEENGSTLDRSTEAGRANESALDDIVQSTLELAASTFEMTHNEEDASRVIEDGRQVLLDKLEAFGITGQAAEDYADSLGLIPENVETIVGLEGVDEAEARLNELARHREALVSVRWDEDGTGGSMMGGRRITPNADGGMYDYGSGIYAGGDPLYKFAERETGWEAFISGKPSERDRNVGVWMQAGERLGVMGGGGSAAPNVTVSQHFNLPPGFTASQIEAISGRGVQKALR